MASVSAPASLEENVRVFFSRNEQTEPSISEKNGFKTYSASEGKFSITTDSFGGLHINLDKDFSGLSIERFRESLADLSQKLRETKERDSVWVNFPNPVTLNHLAMLPDSFQAGSHNKSNIIQDMKENKLKAWEWVNIDKECTIPPGATHNIGAQALLIDTTGQVLFVQNVRRSKDWNLPGGSYDLQHDASPRDTAWREMKEESGIQTTPDLDKTAKSQAKYAGMLEFSKNQFAPAINQVWTFFVENLSKEATNPPAEEILQTRWFS
ncbi:MAG: NUDIX hydrolase, partial [Chlamydiales bacterium]|nr:NUDIX hydrolase [Chlamydiales bacterium]